ncbi:hypothetical protein COCSUDRAFT_31951 [Coccomyxa subellipsoidea C-169]|uniref:Uncharacterized protein n=1 Tax=Coccomyxa subellipsoidea (strain C-169) TaxID=574566 RepID=I0Z992_COCSC|nr:hypothetical protein COCSUDRAFT_31951 [Coccomyxa subellipsoidea C-169]EIE27211.1 hypothetical protein COCSUDRAFT_31951 [Coccomyxa subellipsoidea C-169]|eukprot:XP_005651755.1 hypothetical protein COCSUDRAFT_31951 [Coccomyxa subellipsoidea C-169]
MHAACFYAVGVHDTPTPPLSTFGKANTQPLIPSVSLSGNPGLQSCPSPISPAFLELLGYPPRGTV